MIDNVNTGVLTRGRLWSAAVLLLFAAGGACRPEAEGWGGEAASTPQRFAPDVVSTPEREYGLALTPDGREAYFTRRGRRGPPSILLTRFRNGTWSDPVPADFAVVGDEAPHVTADGRRVLFVSRRPVPGSRDASENLWSATRGPDGWSTPRPLEGTVNQPAAEVEELEVGSEVGPVLTRDGSLLYATRVDAEWGFDLYVASPDGAAGWSDPRPLTVNGYADETSPALSPDGELLVFQASRAGGLGDQDLWVARRTPYGWSAPRPLPEPLNSAGADGWPSFSADGRWFFFASDRDDRPGYYDIYWVDARALEDGADPTS